ncbi:hypothetical protein PSTEL_24980 [Paenibacillus stellifer]|uniref:DUF115 domain-containing protein n=1 Tax=Paenibacillus stellifer TaxID=169760 RepID=A0A089M323_9BACL|nr:6-hydroxymethylpterin diphosphokinase MptE-like protein [Paenibacillus stellifer]AIQ65878.1 hypothetical protein PSTEL_24980 [Paenibacillus stellifer]
MSFLTKNKRFIQKNYPSLISLIEDDDINDPMCTITETKNNETNMVVTVDRQEYFLHSKYNATAEARNWISTLQSEVTSSGHVLLFGIGLGYFLEALLELSEVVQVYVCEPSIIVFNQMIRTRDISKMFSDSRIKLVAVGENPLFLKQIANQISTYLVSNRLVTAIPPIYKRLFMQTFEDLSNDLKDSMIDQIGNLQTYTTFQNLWITNVLKNMRHTIISSSVNLLENAWEGSKAIVVGSGPSLQEDISYLKQLKDKCLIIAAGSSIQALQYNGIQPHLVVSMDGGEPNLRVFENIDTSQVPLLFIPQINSDILEIYKGEMVFALFTRDLISNYLWSNHSIPKFLNTSTVTGTAIQAARYMGATEIILMGQDLSYPQNQFYTPGVAHIPVELQKKQLDEAANLFVPNVDGGENPTTLKMHITLRDLEVLIKLEMINGLSFTNASRRGAHIEGTEYRALDDLITELLELPSRDFNVAVRIESPTKDNQVKLLEQMKTKLDYILKQSKTVEQKLKVMLETVEIMKKNSSARNRAKVNKNLNKVDELWKWITNRETFTVFFAFTRGHHMNIYKRYIPMIVETQDPLKKAELISEHLGNLLARLKEFLPELQELLKNTLDHLDILSTEIRGDTNERLV